MDLDKAFICKLLQEPKITVLKEVNVTEDMLMDAAPKALEYIQDFFGKHGKMPTLDTVEIFVGEGLEEDCPEPFDFYVDLVKKRWAGNTINNAIIKSGEALDKRDVDTALAELKSTIKKISDRTVSVGDIGLIDMRETTKERWERYDKLKKLKGGIDGYPFPWEALNDSTRGIHDGELWIIVARMKIGKSWTEIALADHFFRFQNKVLLATMEMSVSQMSTRLDSMFAKLPYGDFKCGKLDPHLEVKFADSLQEWKGDNQIPLWICGKGRLRTVQDLELLVEELDPDIVLIDGMYLMRTRGSKGSESKWEKVSTIADELQDLTQRKQIPIIASTQFNRKVTRKKIDAGSEDIGFSLEIAQNCIASGTLVHTDRGFIPVEALVGVSFKAWNGIRYVKANGICSGKKLVRRVCLNNGQYVRCSDDHKFLVLKNGALDWVRCDKLVKGDIVCRIQGDSSYKYPLPKTAAVEGYGRSVTFPEELTEDLACWLGLLTGDGYVREEASWALAAFDEDRDVIDWFNRTTEDIFGVSLSRIDENKHTLVARLNCRPLARYAYSVLGLTRGVAHQKKIPFTILQSGIKIQAAFLRGLFEADGNVEVRGGRVRYTSVSPVLALQVSVLLQNMGIPCCVSERALGKLSKHPAHVVEFSATSASSFKDLIGCVGSRKSSHLDDLLSRVRNPIKNFMYGNERVAMVVSVEKEGKREVMYDVVTRSKEHMFSANGIAVHNCHGLIGMFQTEEMRNSKEMLLKLLEHREGEPINLYLNWDFTTMDFSQKSVATNEQLAQASDEDEDGAIQY